MRDRCFRPNAFTLIELLVVISIIALLIGILLPVLGSARENARSIQCASAMRQWGIAYAVYAAENRQMLPQEDGDRPDGTFPGTAQANTNPRAWFNALPNLIDAPTYGEIYDGSSVGDDGGYANEWVWYCPEQIRDGEKNSNSGLNSFHYGMNGLLNGEVNNFPISTLNFTPDLAKTKQINHISIAAVPQTSSTIQMGEVFGNVAIVFPHTGEPTSSNRYGRLEFARHFSDSGNILFMDGHVSLHNTSLDDADSANRLDDYTTNPYQRTDPGIVWGVFGR